MKYYLTLLWICFVLAVASLIGGIVAKATGFVAFGLAPISYLRFSEICLLFAIAISLAEISLRMERKG